MFEKNVRKFPQLHDAEYYAKLRFGDDFINDSTDNTPLVLL
jgi:hypothetical protein